jgi:hypothetical protein
MKFDVLVNKLEFKAFVESETTPGVFYKVESDDDGKLTCSCRGFQNRFKCKHVTSALKDLGLID